MLRVIFIVILFNMSLLLSAREPFYVRLVNKITSEFLLTKAKEKNVSIQGYGGGMMDDVKMVSISLISYDSLTVDEARILYIELCEYYLNMINQNEKLLPYLHNYPFDWHNLKLSLTFYDKKSRKRQSDSVAFVFHSLTPGIMYYDICDKETNRLVTCYEETYEEALKIVKETGILDPKPEALVDNKIPHKKKRRSDQKLSSTEKKLLNM